MLFSRRLFYISTVFYESLMHGDCLVSRHDVADHSGFLRGSWEQMRDTSVSKKKKQTEENVNFWNVVIKSFQAVVFQSQSKFNPVWKQKRHKSLSTTTNSSEAASRLWITQRCERPALTSPELLWHSATGLPSTFQPHFPLARGEWPTVCVWKCVSQSEEKTGGMRKPLA